jgi:preprotein translocase subunit SecG
MYVLLIGIYVIVCILLVIVVLMQKGRGGGLTETLGGTFQSVFGPRVANVLVRATAILATLFLLLSLVIAKLSTNRTKSIIEKIPSTQEKK